MGDAAALELVSQSAADVDNEIGLLGSKRDEELFVLDTVGDGTSSTAAAVVSKKGGQQGMKKSKKNRISEKDERQIKRLISLHGKEGVVMMNEQHRRNVSQKKKS